jgi:hypothetical protein
MNRTIRLIVAWVPVVAALALVVLGWASGATMAIGDHVAAYFAAGDFAAGVFAAGQFAAGVFAVGMVSTGFAAAGVFASACMRQESLHLVGTRPVYSRLALEPQDCSLSGRARFLWPAELGPPRAMEIPPARTCFWR